MNRFPSEPPSARPRRDAAGLAARAAMLLLALGWPAERAAAHALVVASDPAAGAVLAEAPARLMLRFNSRIDPARSRLQLIPAEAVSHPPLALEIAAGTEPTVLEAACPPLPGGAWRLRWQVLAVDGHITRGDIPFRIGAAPR